MSDHVIPARVSGPVGYKPREMPAISEGTPADAEEVRRARLESIAKAAKATSEARAAEPAKPAAVTTIKRPAPAPAPAAKHLPATQKAQARPPASSKPAPALKQARSVRPAAVVKAAARHLGQDEILAVLPDSEDLAITRAAWAEALGLSHPVEITRLSSTFGRLKKLGRVRAYEGADGYQRYWRTPDAELRPSGIRRKGRTLKILNALPDSEAKAVKSSTVCEQLGISSDEYRSAINVMYRLEAIGDIASKPHPDRRCVKLYWRTVPKVDESLAREEAEPHKNALAPRQADRASERPAVDRGERLLLERADRYRMLADVLDRLDVVLGGLSSADARDVLLAAADVFRGEA